ncbi:hypothetical protein [Ideonella sp. A 288]|uniref:hypothetical protein n=1 Tax=Ideonella sp. A 288 TaxID=1962181 RepID=UPI000B4AEFF1|nr:hypothetical protein [Ideonella sp. A 288]
MKVVPFTADHAETLIAGLDRAGLDAPLLRVEPFMRHYYLSSPDCQLLLLLDDDDRITATLGSERVRLRIGGNLLDAAVISSTFSLSPGAFPMLLMQWMRSTELGVAFPGNPLLQAMFARQRRWVAVPGLRRFWLNWGYPVSADDPGWKQHLKPLARWIRRVDASRFEDRVRGLAPAGLSLREEARFDDTMVPTAAAFGLRIEPGADYLNWRFDTTLDHVKHRIFRIEREARSVGHVVISEWAHCVNVSHCDAEDAHTLVCAVLMAVSRVNQGEDRHRAVILTSMHAGMQPVLAQFGFSPAPADSPMYLAAFGSHGLPIDRGDDWLVNLDLGDGGMFQGMFYRPS